MTSGRANQKTRSESGFILVVVLWILAALAALASTYSVYVGNAAFATQVNDDRLRIRNAISSGIELTAYQLLAAPDNARPPQGAFTIPLARSTIDVTFISESARVDLNAAPKSMLEGLFAAVGVDPSSAGARRRTQPVKTAKSRRTSKPASTTRPGRPHFRTFSNCHWCSVSPHISSNAFCRS
jgi:hypothetical protein